MQVKLALSRAVVAIDKNDVVSTPLDLSSVQVPDLTEWAAALAEKKRAAKQAKLDRRGKGETAPDMTEWAKGGTAPDMTEWAQKKAARMTKSLEALIKRTATRYKIMQKLSNLFFPKGLEYDYEEAYRKELEVVCTTKEEKKAQNKRIRAAQFKYNRFASAYKLYIESEQVILDYDDRNNFFDHILGMYDECVAEAARIDREAEEKARAEKAAKDAEIAEIKLERRIRKDAKKDAKAHGAAFDEAYLEKFRQEHADDYAAPTTAADESADGAPPCDIGADDAPQDAGQTSDDASDAKKEGSDNED